jgi:hypothetical protein
MSFSTARDSNLGCSVNVNTSHETEKDLCTSLACLFASFIQRTRDEGR